MNKELGLKLIITGDGKVAVQASKEVQAALAGVATESKKAGNSSATMANEFEKNSRSAGSAVDGLGSKIKGLGITAGATFTAIKLVGVTREFDILNAGLKTATGSADLAASAFVAIQDFAASTPYALQQSVDAFVKLKNYGLDPSERALRSYGNTASSLGKDLSQMIEAVADASTGEMERLKEFGIRASIQGNQVAFTFKGVKTTVKNESEAIQDYLIKLGENNFATAMQDRMNSLDGILSNLGDEWDTLFLNISKQGIGDVISASASVAVDGLGGINDYLESGIFEQDLAVVSSAFAGFGDDVDGEMSLLTDSVSSYFDEIGLSGQKTAGFLEREFAASLQNTRSFIKIMIVEAASAADKVGEFFKSENNSMAPPGQKRDDKIAAIDKNRMDSISSILDEHNAAIAKTNELITATAKLRAEHQKQREEGRKTSEDRLAQFKNNIAAAVQDDPKAKKAAESAAKHAKEQADAAIKKLNDRAQAMREGANPDVAFIANIEEYTAAYNRGAISISDYVFWLTKLDDTRQQANGGTPDTGWADITAIQDEVSLQRSQDATKGVDDYVKSLDRAKDSASALSDVSSSIFDGALGGVNLIAGAFNTLTKSIADTTKELEANSAARIANDAEPESAKKSADRIKIANEEKRLQNEQLKNSLSGIRQISSATASMFKENTNARRAFNVIALAASVTERMADIAGLGIKAASAVLEQGKGEPYTAFARMAAMAAIVGSVLSAAGAGTFQFGGSSVPKGQVPTSPDSGTVLGDPSAKSESISKTYTLLQDIHATEYRELRGINSGVAAMNKGITDSITKLFQAGGLQTPNISGLGTKISGIGSFLTSIDPVNKMGLDPIGKFILKGLFGTTKTSITGGGIYAGGNSLASILNGGDISAAQYTEITKTKKSWFSKSSKVSEVMGPVNADFQDSLSEIFRGMGTSMLAMSTEFGNDMTSSINNYVIPKLKISLHGLSSDDMIKTLNNALSTQLDTMTSAIFGSMIKKYQKLGEGMFETATRLVSEKAIVLDAIDLVGSSFKGDAIDMADGLVQLAGGIKEFQAQFDDYYRKFYSESEQLANTTRRLTASLADMNITLPDSRNAYRDLVNAQQLDTEAGRERYDQLLKLSTAADTYYASMEKLRESMKLLTQDNFKSAVDYKRYLGLASLSGIKAATDLLPANPNTTFMPTGSPNQLLPGIASTPMTTAFMTVAESNNAVANEVKQLRIEQQAQALAIAKNTADMAKLLKRWEGDGLPATRVIA